MAIIKKKYGYQFIEKLCAAIEIFTNNLEKQDKEIFIYKGANLKYALEKLLYFIFYSDDNLYKIFCDWNTKNLLSTIKVSSQMQKELALIMCDKQIDDKLVISKQQYLSFFKRFLIIPIKISLNLFTYFISSQFSHKRVRSKKNLILFYVVHEKFIRYLKPILSSLGNDYIFYTDDKNTNLVLKQEKIPNIDTPPFTYSINIFPNKDDCISFYGLVDLYNHLYKIVNHLKPKKVVVVEGNAPDYEIMNQVCKQLKVPTICIQHGWPSFMHTGFRSMSYTKMLVWGKGFKKLHKPFNPEQAFIATGSHVINIKEKEICNNSKKKAISFFLQPPSRLTDEEDLRQIIDLIKWVAFEFPDFLIIVREHPIYDLSDDDREQLNSFSNICFMPSKKYKLNEVLDLSYLTVAIFSTTILESIAAGVLPIIFNNTSMLRYYPDVDSAEAGIEVKDLKNAKIIIKKLVEDKQYYKSFQPKIEKFRKEYFLAGGSKAIKNIIAELEN